MSSRGGWTRRDASPFETHGRRRGAATLSDHSDDTFGQHAADEGRVASHTAGGQRKPDFMSSDPAVRQRRRHKVLIVDDNEVCRAVARESLEQGWLRRDRAR